MNRHLDPFRSAIPSRTFIGLAAWLFLSTAVVSGADDLEGLESIYGTPADLDSGPVILLIDPQHPEVTLGEIDQASGRSPRILAVQSKLETLAGIRCVLLHHIQLEPADMERSSIQAVLIAPRRRGISRERDDELFAIIRNIRAPAIGFSTGHTLIARAYGGSSGAMRDLEPDEPDPRPDFYPGQFKIWGPSEVRFLERDPLFEGIPEVTTFYGYYAHEIKALPAQFLEIATAEESRYQAIKHRDKILYGVQFRPDLWDDRLPDGEIVLRNFFRIAGLGAR